MAGTSNGNGGTMTVEESYPEKYCKSHPNQMWEWDGFSWVCAKCVIEDETPERGSTVRNRADES